MAPKRADDGFSRGQRRDQADADFPVEAQRLDDGLDGAADGAGQAVLDGGRFAAGVGQVRHHPEDHRHQQDDRAGALQEDFGAVQQAQSERLESGPAVGGHLQQEGRCALFRTLDFSRRAVTTAARKPSRYKPSSAATCSGDHRAQQVAVRNEGRDQQRIDRQARRAGHEGRDQDGGDAVALVLDGARRQNGRHGAAVCRKQRDEDFCPASRRVPWCGRRSAPRAPGIRNLPGCR